jgi:hypothetical protein
MDETFVGERWWESRSAEEILDLALQAPVGKNLR